MKIIFAAQKYDYGDSDRGLSFEYENFYSTLIGMGHEVEYFDFYSKANEIGRDKMNNELEKMIYDKKPELLFCCLFNDELDKEMILGITKNTNTVTYNWFFDDQWRFDNFSRYWAPAFNWVSTTDPVSVEKYKQLGYKNVIKIQYGFNNFVYKKYDLPKIYDVAFVGQLHGTRKNFINWLLKKGINVETFGFGTRNGHIDQEQMIKIFNQSKINLCFMNLARDPNWKGFLKIFFKKDNNKIVFDFGNIVSNFKFFLSKQLLQVKARNFEIPGAGGFILTNYSSELSNFFDTGNEIAVFKNKRDLLKKIRYYLANDKEREDIAIRGYRRSIKNHTYEKRFNDIFNYIFSANPKRKL